jgi:hypothetical protein
VGMFTVGTVSALEDEFHDIQIFCLSKSDVHVAGIAVYTINIHSGNLYGDGFSAVCLLQLMHDHYIAVTRSA